MSIADKRSIGDVIDIVRAAANTAVTAGGGGDNAAVTGVIIDRAALAYPESCVVAIPFTATLAAAATLSITATLQNGETSNLADAATLSTVASTVAATGGGGGTTETGVFKLKVSLRGSKRYVRANFTPDLSAANTDTAALSAVIVFGGAERLPR